MKIEKKSIKTGDLLAGFIRYLENEKNASPHTVSAYFSGVQEFALKVMDSDESFNDWAMVDQNQARSFVMALHESGNSKRSIQRKLSSMRSFFRYLMLIGKAQSNPFKNMPMIKTGKPLPKVMSINQVE
jgi:site-specific recombinase XerD